MPRRLAWDSKISPSPRIPISGVKMGKLVVMHVIVYDSHCFRVFVGEFVMRVGDRVLYHPSRGMRYYGQEMCGMVTKVHPDGRVNCVVFEPWGVPMSSPPTHIPVSGGDEQLELSPVGWVEGLEPKVTPNWKTAEIGVEDAGYTKVSEAQRAKLAELVTKSKASTGLPPGVKIVEQRPATAEEIKGVGGK